MTPAEIVMRLHPYQNLSHERTLQKPFPLIHSKRQASVSRRSTRHHDIQVQRLAIS